LVRNFSLRTTVKAGVVLVLILSLAASGCAKKSEGDQASEALGRGLKLHQQGQLLEASKAYREVLVHDPSNKWAFYNLGLIDQQSGRNTSAEANYRQALELDANFAAALFNLAIVLTKTKPDEAASLYRRLIQVNPDDPIAHLNLGFLLLDQGKTDEGTQELEKAVQLDPKLKSRLPASPSPGSTPTPTKSSEPKSPQPTPSR
jgi:Tfp pilus assembly protein PilF